ncbi:hypothetical protein GSI_02774 [Ganoderma sinense ZZ0214-1]|uniref:F-box domain-containing protein n=1 Tax=Ganoderma sinense ZZ0214-1 TaxID=1077348 RepID=A0A2G8SMJ0_9APHY|nr:hypothetical protein GSI_02774 [Ganoderma sinense ZZ0214-1]
MAFTSLPLDVIRHILASAPAPTLSRFSASCHAADKLVIEELNFRYDSLLANYVDDRAALRTLLGATSSNIAGSSAAAVAGLRDQYVPGDLDIYCDELGAPIVRDHFVDNERYEVIEKPERLPACPSPSAIAHAESLIPITDVDRAYQRALAADGGNSTNASAPTPSSNHDEYTGGIAYMIHLRREDVYVDIICSTTSSSTFPIVNFWSTAPMCFLTADAIHILYPRLQEQQHALLNPFRLPLPELEDNLPELNHIVAKQKAHTRSLIAKYVDRGYDVQHTEHPWDVDVSIRACVERKAAACLLYIRWVGDARGMHLSLCGDVNTRMRSSPFQHGLQLYTSVWCRGGYPY